MTLLGVPGEFFIFALTLAAIALLHEHALLAAVAGLLATLVYKLTAAGLAAGAAELLAHFAHESPALANLMLLLVGFAVLANQFELSGIPGAVPQLLPRSWTAGLVLLAIVYVLSIFLDNIAAAVVGGVIARHAYGGRVSVGYLAAMVAAANAGGAGSVLGDTTTTIMWINGIPPVLLVKAFIASAAAFAVFGPLASLQQHRFTPIETQAAPAGEVLDWSRATIVLLLLATLVLVNVAGGIWAPAAMEAAPVLGLGLWAAILCSALWHAPQWQLVFRATKGAVFLTALVATASLMPVERLPVPSWQTTFGLGLLSAVFDNIPLTALALQQGGYDWGLLAYAVGFGGSMLWFGSSAGIALSNHYPEIRSVGAWLRYGWHVPLAYVAGFFVLLAIMGWQTG